MRAIQSAGDLRPVGQNVFERQRASLEPFLQSLAVEELHHQVVDPVLAAHVVKRADVRVIQAGDRLGLTLETRAEGVIVRQVLGQNFDGDHSIQPRVLGFVDVPHPARVDG